MNPPAPATTIRSFFPCEFLRTHILPRSAAFRDARNAHTLSRFTHRRRHAGAPPIGAWDCSWSLIDNYEHGIARGVVRFAPRTAGLGPVRLRLDVPGHGLPGAVGRRRHRGAHRVGPGTRTSSRRGESPWWTWRARRAHGGFRRVSDDDARRAHLTGRRLRLGHRRFAFCGVSSVGWSLARREAFRGTVTAPRLSVFEQSLVWWEKLQRSEQFDRWIARPEPAGRDLCLQRHRRSENGRRLPSARPRRSRGRRHSRRGQRGHPLRAFRAAAFQHRA